MEILAWIGIVSVIYAVLGIVCMIGLLFTDFIDKREREIIWLLLPFWPFILYLYIKGRVEERRRR